MKSPSEGPASLRSTRTFRNRQELKTAATLPDLVFAENIVVFFSGEKKKKKKSLLGITYQQLVIFFLGWKKMLLGSTRKWLVIFRQVKGRKIKMLGFPGGSVLTNPPANAGDLGSIPGSGRCPWRRKRQPTPGFLPGESHGQGEPGGPRSTGSQRVGYDSATKQQQQRNVTGNNMSVCCECDLKYML